MLYNIFGKQCLEDSSGVSILIPARNEEMNLAGLLEKIERVMDYVEKPYEIIVIDDGSTDRTSEVAAQFCCKIIKLKGSAHGKGLALREGFLQSKYDILLMMDADGSHRPEDIPYMLLELDKGHGIVIGNRFLGGSDEYTLLRSIGNRFLTALFCIFFSVQLTDALNGFKVFHRSIFDSFEYKSKEFEIEIELLANAIRLGKSIGQCPSHELGRKGGKTKSFVFRHGILFFLQIIREWCLNNIKLLKKEEERKCQ